MGLKVSFILYHQSARVSLTPNNSLVGSSPEDGVGFHFIFALTNGNYVITSPFWDHGEFIDVGAVTWADGNVGIVGEITSDNSLIGATSSDMVGVSGVRRLSNGNYVVVSGYWDNGDIYDAGAVTWGDGTRGISGLIDKDNSLVGSSPEDRVGSLMYENPTGVFPLTNGNYVVTSPNWGDGQTSSVGAATWGDGTTGITGVVTQENSLIGSKTRDYVGGGGVVALTNGNYVVVSNEWNNGEKLQAGAVTWGDGTKGTVGIVGADNSLVSSHGYARVGSVKPLTNGNYVVAARMWSTDAAGSIGFVAWGDGLKGLTGFPSSENALVGVTPEDQVGATTHALSNGNYVVGSHAWDNVIF